MSVHVCVKVCKSVCMRESVYERVVCIAVCIIPWVSFLFFFLSGKPSMPTYFPHLLDFKIKTLGKKNTFTLDEESRWCLTL